MCDRFIIPEKLYGRSTEVATLLAAFDRIANPSKSRSQALPGNEDPEALPPLPLPHLPPLNREAEPLEMRSQAEPRNEGNSRSQTLPRNEGIPTIECFPGQLNQVFMNILANAIDALSDRDL